MSNHELSVVSRQFFRFIVTGVISTILNYAVFYILLTALLIPYLISSAVGFLSGMFLGYRLNRDWTYQAKSQQNQHMPRYVLLYIFSLMAGLGFLRALVSLAGIPPEIANVATIALTTMINFAGTKLWVFKA